MDRGYAGEGLPGSLPSSVPKSVKSSIRFAETTPFIFADDLAPQLSLKC